MFLKLFTIHLWLTWCTIPDPGGTTSMFLNAVEPHFKNANLSLFRSNSCCMFDWSAFFALATSTWTEWSMTRSTGTWKQTSLARQYYKHTMSKLFQSASHQRVYLIGITTETFYGIAHSSKVHNCWDSSKILHNANSFAYSVHFRNFLLVFAPKFSIFIKIQVPSQLEFKF